MCANAFGRDGMGVGGLYRLVARACGGEEGLRGSKSRRGS